MLSFLILLFIIGIKATPHINLHIDNKFTVYGNLSENEVTKLSFGL